MNPTFLQNVPRFVQEDFEQVLCDPPAHIDDVEGFPEGKRISLSGLVTEVYYRHLNIIHYNSIYNTKM